MTKPARRRRTKSDEVRTVGGELAGSPQAALPSPQDDEKPKRSRKKSTDGEPGVEKPKRARKVSATAVARKKTSAPKTATTRKKK